MPAYYNEINRYAAQWLRNLIQTGHIAPGDVDERSIVDVRADDLRGYEQCHFFAGIGGWSVALRLAGWPDDRSVWTGSCPCQPFSAAGAGKAADDERHLWPAWFSHIAERRPAIIFGEQVEAAIGWGWLDDVFADLEGQGYACGATVLPACGVGAPHIRQRLWFVADASGERAWRDAGNGASAEAQGDSERLANGIDASDAPVACGPARDLANAEGRGFAELRHAAQPRRGGHADSGFVAGELGITPGVGWSRGRQEPAHGEPGQASQDVLGDAESKQVGRTGQPWQDGVWLPCTDGKARPVESGTFPLAHGIPGRVGRLRAYGNAIVPQVAAEFIAAAHASLTGDLGK